MEKENNYQKESANTRVYYHTRNNNRARSRRNGVLIGLLIILFASLKMYFNLNFDQGNSIMSQIEHIIFSWPMILVVISLFSFARREWYSGLFMLFLGVVFLSPKISFLLHSGWNIVINSSMIICGVAIAFGIFVVIAALLGKNNFNGSRRWERYEQALDERARKEGIDTDYAQASFGVGADNKINYNFVFSGADQVFVEPVFPGGNIKCLFGGMSLDLRHTNLQPGVTHLNIDATFGGVSLKVPTGWNVEIRSNCVLGGFVDERRFFNATQDNDRKLVINARCILGGGNVE